MKWMQGLSIAIDYIESHLTDDISIAEIASRSYSSSAHFQMVFHLVMGITIGEYIRNRRLSLAAQDLLQPNCKVIDIALRYQYDTPESFSKAFTRFHGTPPSKARRDTIKLFHPLSISITLKGGFAMPHKISNGILLVEWNKIDEQDSKTLASADIYNQFIEWAYNAREQNPRVFDALSAWGAGRF